MSEDNKSPAEENPTTPKEESIKRGVKLTPIRLALFALVVIALSGDLSHKLTGDATGEEFTDCGGAYYDEETGQLIGDDGQVIRVDEAGNIQQSISALTSEESAQQEVEPRYKLYTE